MKYPITVNKIEFKKSELITKPLFGNIGDMVAIRPCADEYKNKTFLGVLLGELPLSFGVEFKKDNGVLVVKQSYHNPAIFIPDINKIIFGCESWWGVIQDEKQLKDITDTDIDNVWYVKALKQITHLNG